MCFERKVLLQTYPAEGYDPVPPESLDWALVLALRPELL
jgi:hypothetical protein